MNRDLPLDSGADEQLYVDAIERMLRHVRGRAVILSPIDMQHLSGWYRRGVPLALVLRVMETVHHRASQRGMPTRAKSLAFFAEAVEEAFRFHQQTELGKHGQVPDLVPLPEVLSQAAEWIERSKAPAAARARCATALRSMAGGGIAEGAGDPLASLDAVLLESCWSELGEVEREAINARAGEEIRPFAERMTGDSKERALRAARHRHLRKRFELPDLTLLPLIAGQIPRSG